MLIEYIQYQAHLPHPDLRQESASSGSKKGNLSWGIDNCLGATQSVIQVRSKAMENSYRVRKSFPESSAFQYSEETIAGTETNDTSAESP